MSAILASPAALSTREPPTGIVAPGIPSAIAKIYTTSGALYAKNQAASYLSPAQPLIFMSKSSFFAGAA